MAKIVVVGSANVDLVIEADVLPQPGQTILGRRFSSHLGGKGLNQAVAAARAGCSVAMIARVGADPQGGQLRAGMEREGIDTSRVGTVDEPSGVALIVTAAGDNIIVVASGANSRLSARELGYEDVCDANGVLAQLETPIDGVIRAAELAQQRGAWFMLDPAPAQPLPGELIAKTDWLTPNEGEAKALIGARDQLDGFEAARVLRERGARGVVVKLGSRGVVLSYGQADPIALPAFQVEAVDTTAAGDAFNGAFAAALAEGRAPPDAAQFAIAAAALSVTRLGAQTSIAGRAEINAFLEYRL